MCCRCQHVKFSRLYDPEGNGRTANPMIVCVCAGFFFLILNSVLACCLLFAVCDKWVDFRGGDAVQQCNALLMFYV